MSTTTITLTGHDLHAEISRVDDIVYAAADQNYLQDKYGSVANPTGPHAREMRYLAALMTARDGKTPSWARPFGHAPDYTMDGIRRQIRQEDRAAQLAARSQELRDLADRHQRAVTEILCTGRAHGMGMKDLARQIKGPRGALKSARAALAVVQLELSQHQTA